MDWRVSDNDHRINSKELLTIVQIKTHGRQVGNCKIRELWLCHQE